MKSRCKYYECESCGYLPSESHSDFVKHVNSEEHKLNCPGEDTMHLMWRKHREDRFRQTAQSYTDEYIKWISGDAFHCSICDSKLMTYQSVRSHKNTKKHCANVASNPHYS